MTSLRRVLGNVAVVGGLVCWCGCSGSDEAETISKTKVEQDPQVQMMMESGQMDSMMEAQGDAESGAASGGAPGSIPGAPGGGVPGQP